MNHQVTSKFEMQLNQSTLREFCLTCAGSESGFISEEPDVTIAYAGVSPLNRVLSAQFNDDNADERIADVMNTLRGRGPSVLWITSPVNQPADLPEKLMAAGFEHAIHWTCMGIDLGELSPTAEIPNGVTMEEVTELEQSKAWCKAVCTGFGAPEAFHEKMHAVFAAATFKDNSPLRHFMARLDGVPVSGCTIFNGSHAVGAYFIGTVPEARNKGIARAVTHHALLQSRDWGHKSAILQASTLGRPVYARLGFQVQGTMDVYRRSI